VESQLSDGLEGANGGEGAALPERRDPPIEVDVDTEEIGTEGFEAPVEPDEESDIAILWHSNAPWAGTGYGTQTALFAPKLQELLGYKLAFSAFYGLKGSRLGWVAPSGKGYVVYPGGRDMYGNDIIASHAKHWFGKTGTNATSGGLVVTLTDPWVLSADIMSRLPVLAWVPIDHDPLIPKTNLWFKRSAALPLAMSLFGKAVLEDAGFKDVLYAPHGYAAKDFYPTNRVQARKALGLPKDAFIVGMVAANKGWPSRKCFSEAILAFSRFKEKRPDAILYLHTKLQDVEGENIPALCDAAKIRPFTTDGYALQLGAPTAMMHALFSSFDVLLNPSQGEGFGVPMIEAQACGTPVVCTNFSASPEVAPASAGNWNVGGQPEWTIFDSWQLTPDVEEIEAALVEAYEESEEDRVARRLSVLEHAKPYEVDTVVPKYFKPAVQEAIERISWSQKSFIRHEV